MTIRHDRCRTHTSSKVLRQHDESITRTITFDLLQNYRLWNPRASRNMRRLQDGIRYQVVLAGVRGDQKRKEEADDAMRIALATPPSSDCLTASLCFVSLENRSFKPCWLRRRRRHVGRSNGLRRGPGHQPGGLAMRIEEKMHPCMLGRT